MTLFLNSMVHYIMNKYAAISSCRIVYLDPAINIEIMQTCSEFKFKPRATLNFLKMLYLYIKYYIISNFNYYYLNVFHYYLQF